eukprot:GHRR01037274.1.p2 GENE.GHRR01037274.1~~GHRR01037274.1.p2  ORF type:complete len:114 (+),score=18.09 GHRR01037274.1:252-593(+)
MHAALQSLESDLTPPQQQVTTDGTANSWRQYNKSHSLAQQVIVPANISTWLCYTSEQASMDCSEHCTVGCLQLCRTHVIYQPYCSWAQAKQRAIQNPDKGEKNSISRQGSQSC